MEIKNKIIDLLRLPDLNVNGECRISNSIIDTIDLIAYELDFPLIIEQSIISNLLIHTCWFKKGLIFKNNQVINYVDYQMGGHNEEPLAISGNIFSDFFNFFDCHFTEKVIVEENIFLKGSNLIGNANEGWVNLFNNELIIKNNVGALDLDGIGKVGG